MRLNEEATASALTAEAGQPWPLGAHFDGKGINFAVFSSCAEAIEVCLFDRAGMRETSRFELREYTDEVWHGYLPGAQPGLVYGLRAYGPFSPEHGLRFNSHKLLIDPYARALAGSFRWSPTHFSLDLGQPGHHAAISQADNARDQLKCVVTTHDFDWSGDTYPGIPYGDSVLYEVHVKGFTARHPDVPAALRGTYLGLASEAAIAHLKRVGVTAVELLPVHHWISEQHLVNRGLSNYWGYNTIGFFAPDARFAIADPVTEFKTMVKALHAGGIEVILDVVYNHTAEGDHNGPTLSFRGLDNLAYYRLRHGHPGYYENHTGCGNSVNLAHPRVLQMVLDSLRYWVTEMHVDGFRFDLATTLGREEEGYQRGASFFDALLQDPVLARVKLIAEPWDIGFGGYQLGHFPPGFAEWNDRYRDTARAFWLRQTAYIGEMAKRIAGSSGEFRHHGRRPHTSVNFVTAHDGFALADLVSYNEKHNHANGEDNHDGTTDNRSWNCGVEGPTDSEGINALRRRLRRSLLATLFFSQGTPMLVGGDELGRTQRGNNNAYCQDNELSWYDWAKADQQFIDFTARLIALRQTHPQLRRHHWLCGDLLASGQLDILWLSREGIELSTAQWEDPSRHTLAFLLGAEVPEESPLLVLFNAEGKDNDFTLPEGRWLRVLDTSEEDGGATLEASGTLELKSRSVALLEALREP